MSERLSPESQAPDFYEERGTPVTLETTDRLFDALEPVYRYRGSRPATSIGIQLANDESVPEELRGIGIYLTRPRGNGPAGPRQASLRSRNHKLGGSLTEGVASRVADYIETSIEEIREAHPIAQGYGQQRKAVKEFLVGVTGLER